jgi:hypothetical protein
MNKKVIDYIQSEVLALARQKYPNNERLQWIYVHGFVSAQLAQAIDRDSSVIYQFKAAVRQAKSKE